MVIPWVLFCFLLVCSGNGNALTQQNPVIGADPLCCKFPGVSNLALYLAKCYTIYKMPPQIKLL